MENAVVISLISGIGFSLAYLDYNRNIFTGKTKPNGATWAIWSAVAVVSAGSYFKASGDFWKSLLPIINIVLCVGTFVLSLIKGKFNKLSRFDWIALGIGLFAVVVWALRKSATDANLIVQLALMIGFVPIWRSILKSPSCEHPRPWWTWVICYSLLVVVIVMRWRGHVIDLVYPINCIIVHASVPILSYIKLRKSRK